MVTGRQGAFSFVGDEEEALVLAVIELRDIDWSADRTAELIALQAGERDFVQVIEEAIRVEVGVAQEFESRAMDLVCAGFVDQVLTMPLPLRRTRPSTCWSGP